MLDNKLELTAQAFDFYRSQAREFGFEAGTQHLGYMFKVHVDETEELAYETGRKMIEGSGNLFLDGSNGKPNPWAMNLPGFNSRSQGNYLPTADWVVRRTRGLATDGEEAAPSAVYDGPAATAEEHDERRREIFDGLTDRYAFIVGTPDTIMPKIRHVLESIRPGNIILWHGDGDFTHEESMRGLRLMGEHVLPGIREIGRELGLSGAFEVDPMTNEAIAAPAAVSA